MKNKMIMIMKYRGTIRITNRSQNQKMETFSAINLEIKTI